MAFPMRDGPDPSSHAKRNAIPHEQFYLDFIWPYKTILKVIRFLQMVAVKLCNRACLCFLDSKDVFLWLPDWRSSLSSSLLILRLATDVTATFKSSQISLRKDIRCSFTFLIIFLAALGEIIWGALASRGSWPRSLWCWIESGMLNHLDIAR